MSSLYVGFIARGATGVLTFEASFLEALNWLTIAANSGESETCAFVTNGLLMYDAKGCYSPRGISGLAAPVLVTIRSTSMLKGERLLKVMAN